MLLKKIIQNKNRLLKLILVALLLSSGFITPVINEYYSKNWKVEIEHLKIDIEQKVRKIVNEQFDILKNTIVKIKLDNEKSQFSFRRTFIDTKILAGLYNQHLQLTNWTNSYPDLDIDSILKNYGEGEYFIFNTPLVTYLSMYERFDGKLLFLSVPLEKKYRLNEKYFDSIHFLENIETKQSTEIKIITDNYKSFDGRESTFNLINNYNKPIAEVVFTIPTRDSIVGNLMNIVSLFQSVVLIVLLSLWGFNLRKYLIHFQNNYFTVSILSVYMIFFRLILLFIEFPSNILHSTLSEPASFSSTFAFGIVKSPIELLLTMFFTFLILQLFSSEIIVSETAKRENNNISIGRKIFYIILLCLLVFAYLLIWRAFGAAVKSFVFDSSLRYFKEYEFIPQITLLVMEFNLLLVGLAIFWAVLILLFFINSLFEMIYDSSILSRLSIMLIGLQILGFVFDLFQNKPQGNHLIRFVFIFTSVFFLFKILQKTKIQLLSIIYLFLISSVLSIVMLIYHNSKLENKSLKTIANEITRSNESYIKYSIFKCLSEVNDNYELKYLLMNSNPNLNNTAFVIWSNSDFEKESVISNINIISADKKLLGSFAFEYEEDFIWDWSKKEEDLVGQRIITINSDTGTKTIRGIIPIKFQNRIIGYLEVSALIDLNSIGIETLPPIFNSSNLFSDSPIDVNQLRIFDFQNNELKNYYTDIILPNHAIKSILKARFSKSNEAWSEELIDDKLHTFYIQKINLNGITRILAIGKEEKNAARYLFDFFKIFFVHTIFIILFVLCFYLFRFRSEAKLKYSFRFQLLLAFTVISLLPLIFLAFYFRMITSEKNINSIYYKLAKRADSVENYVQGKNNKDYAELFKSAAHDLDIDYSLFDGKDLIFSTKADYYNAGLISNIINPAIYKSLILGEQKEFVVEEKIDNYLYHSLYHKTNLNGKIFIIKISDLFNNIQLPMTGSEIDVFFFGIYSFTIIMLLFMSVFLANQISYPIRKLTQSMNAVGVGDLNIELSFAGRGEIHDLISGFNKMVKHLKKSQSELAELERETAWKEMAKQVAHEIKNPLTPMKLSIQQLITAKKDNSPKFDEYFSKIADTIIKQIDNLKNIASEFSNFARMPNLKIQKHELISLLKQTIDIFNDEKTETKLLTELPNIYVNIDSEQFQRMMINIIRNSIQAAAKQIHVYCEKEENNVIIKFCDDGLGIPNNIREKIFDINFTTKNDGMGLGLFLTKRFIESMNGSLRLIEYKNYKTTFEIKLPLADEQIN